MNQRPEPIHFLFTSARVQRTDFENKLRENLRQKVLQLPFSENKKHTLYLLT